MWTLQLHMEETCSWLRCLSLNSSARAAALLAQRRAAAGAGGGGGLVARNPRPPRVPAAERREMWRVMQVREEGERLCTREGGNFGAPGLGWTLLQRLQSEHPQVAERHANMVPS